jgi:dTDP-glucose 4,6-dehydratase
MEPERKPAWKSAVVTGDAGFIGTHLCRALLTAGTAVLCVDDFLTSTPDSLHRLRAHPRFALYEADVAIGLPPADQADLVVHLASPASPVDYQRHPLATRALGWRPEVSWGDGLAETLAWFAARPEASAGVRA